MALMSSGRLFVNLNQGHKVIAVDADGTVGTPHIAFPVSGIRVVRGSLEMRRENIFHILYSNFLFQGTMHHGILSEYGVKSAAGPSQRHVCGFRQRPIYHARGVL